VKKVILTLCTLSCTKVFTLWPGISPKKTEMLEPNFKSSGGKSTKTGGSDPTFWASSRPKVFRGRSRPAAPRSVPVVSHRCGRNLKTNS
jgi:hypothetical protein